MTKPLTELETRHPLILKEAERLSAQHHGPVSIRITPSGADLFFGTFPESDSSTVLRRKRPSRVTATSN